MHTLHKTGVFETGILDLCGAEISIQQNYIPTFLRRSEGVEH
jgi:hypothetical protein